MIQLLKYIGEISAHLTSEIMMDWIEASRHSLTIIKLNLEHHMITCQEMEPFIQPLAQMCLEVTQLMSLQH